VPEQLAGKEYSVMYLGRLSLALRTLEIEGFSKTIAEWGPLGEAGRIDWLDNINMDIAFRDSARNNGMPATWLKNEEKMNLERQVRAQAAQAAQMAEAAPKVAKAAKSLNEPSNENSILKEVLAGAA
jgi:hypothetical protein